MEKDIEILEELISVDSLVLGNRDKHSLENLIKGYRELEKENNKFRNGEIVTPKLEAVTRRKIFNDFKNYIPKSKIKEKLEEKKKKRVNK